MIRPLKESQSGPKEIKQNPKKKKSIQIMTVLPPLV